MKTPKRILVIRRDNIGDLVCTTPAIAALRKHYPDAEIGALVNSYNAEVLRGNPNLDYVFTYQKLKHSGNLVNRIKAMSQRLILIGHLRRWAPDVTILAKASYDRNGLNFARLIRAKNIIGYVPNGQFKVKYLPDICSNTPDVTMVHEVEAVNALLNPLGIVDALGPLQVFPDALVSGEYHKKIPAASRRIALHISAREPERRWGVDNFIQLAQYILRTKADTQILLFWSPGEADDPHHPGDDEAADQIVKKINTLNGKENRLVPIPTSKLTELIAALSLCDLFVGADGGAMHLAAGLNKKVLALFENKPDKLNHWYPWQANHVLLFGLDEQNTDVAGIPLKRVIEAVNLLL